MTNGPASDRAAAAFYLNRSLVREVDRRAIEDYGMSGLVLMENAGRGCTDTLCSLGIAGPVVICAGKGNNAGDGFVIARHLDLRGHDVRVVLLGRPEELQGDAATNFRILQRCDVPICVLAEFDAPQLQAALAAADWIVDALLGTGARGEPRPPLDRVLDLLNAHPARKLAVDLPSGLDCDTGQPARHTFRADHTCTFVAAKPGFAAPAAQDFVGRVHVLDIGVPRKLLEEVLKGDWPGLFT
jgi:NAD(P)H-hydrate epimerase